MCPRWPNVFAVAVSDISRPYKSLPDLTWEGIGCVMIHIILLMRKLCELWSKSQRCLRRVFSKEEKEVKSLVVTYKLAIPEKKK